MGAVIPSKLTGLVLLDEGFTHQYVSVANSTLYQATPVPEQPESSGTRAYARLQATGVATREVGYKVRVGKEGQPVGGNAGGTIIWSEGSESSSQIKGWLAYNKVSGFEFARFFQGTLSTWDTYEGYRFPDALTTPDHHVVVVYDDQEDDEIGCSVLDPDTDTWSHSVVADKGSSDYSMPSVVRLPGGRLLCFYTLLTYTRGASTFLTLGFSYSDDTGATWTEGGRHSSGFRTKVWGADDVLRKLRVRHHGGFLTAQIVTYNTGTADYGAWHLLSRDLGASWETVESDTSGDTTPFDAAWDLVGLDDGRCVLFTRASSASSTVYRYVKSTPGQTWSDDPEAENLGGAAYYAAANDSFMGAFQAEEGDIYLLHAVQGSASRILLRKIDGSTLAGLTLEDDALWHTDTTAGASGYAEPIDLNTNDATAQLSWPCPVSYKGSLLLVHGSAAGHNTNHSIHATRLGGYSNVTWESHHFGYRLATGTPVQVGLLYLPIELPADLSAWTIATGGTPPTPTITANGLELDGSTTGSYQIYRAGTAGQPCLYFARVRVEGSRDFSTAGHGLRIHWGDGVNRSEVDLRIGATEARLRDVTASSNLEIFVLEDGEIYDWLISSEGGRIQAFVRKVGDINWTIGSQHTPTTAADAAGNRFTWGILADLSGTSVSHWLAVGVSMETDVASGLPAASYTRPDDLLGRPTSTRPCWLDQGVKLSHVGGSLFRGNIWDIGTRYEDGIQLVDPTLHPSPDVRYHSTRDNAEHILRWQSLSDGLRARPLSPSIGVYLAGLNFPVAYFEGSANASTWTELVEIDARTGLTGLAYSRSVNWVVPDTGTVHAATRYVQMDELVGGYYIFDADGSAGGPWARKIVHNSEGALTSQATRRVEIQVEGDMTGVPFTGDAAIIAPQVLAIGHQIASSYNYYRLRIPAFNTAEGYLTIGTLLVGPFVALGLPPDWGEVLGAEPIGEILTADSGQRRGRQRGPIRRYATLPWPGGWPTRNLANAAPDYIDSDAAGGGAGIGIRYDAGIWEGILARTKGGVLPCVYAPEVDLSSGATLSYSYPGRNQSLYSRVMGEVSRSVMVRRGTDGAVYTLPAVRLEGEV